MHDSIRAGLMTMNEYGRRLGDGPKKKNKHEKQLEKILYQDEGALRSCDWWIHDAEKDILRANPYREGGQIVTVCVWVDNPLAKFWIYAPRYGKQKRKKKSRRKEVSKLRSELLAARAETASARSALKEMAEEVENAARTPQVRSDVS